MKVVCTLLFLLGSVAVTMGQLKVKDACSKAASKVADKCGQDMECPAAVAGCTKAKCVCKKGFYSSDGMACVKQLKAGETCTKSSNEEDYVSLGNPCEGKGQCVTVSTKTTCAPALKENAVCEFTFQCVKNLICVGTTKKCSKYLEKKAACETGSDVVPCKPGLECAKFYASSEAGPSGVSTSDKAYHCRSPLLEKASCYYASTDSGQLSKDSQDCLGEKKTQTNLECKDKHCKCKDNFSWNKQMYACLASTTGKQSTAVGVGKTCDPEKPTAFIEENKKYCHVGFTCKKCPEGGSKLVCIKDGATTGVVSLTVLVVCALSSMIAA